MNKRLVFPYKVGSAEFIKTLTCKIAFRGVRRNFGSTIEAAEFVGKKSKELLSDFVATREVKARITTHALSRRRCSLCY